MAGVDRSRRSIYFIDTLTVDDGNGEPSILSMRELRLFKSIECMDAHVAERMIEQDFVCDAIVVASKAPRHDSSYSMFKLPHAADVSATIARPIIILTSEDGRELTQQLLALTSRRDIEIIALETDCNWRHRPILVQSIPKSGTHLLTRCLEVFGIEPPAMPNLPQPSEFLLPGHYYNLQHLNPKTLGCQLVQREPLLRAMSSSVILNIIRDPRDIAVSMNYYLVDFPDYHLLSTFLTQLTENERLTSLIEGTYPFPMFINDDFQFSGGISDLCETYRTWWSGNWKNVWTVRFEDLIGPAGGSPQQDQIDAIWALQLVLHVSGRPEVFGAKIFHKESPTFREGVIGSHLRNFSADHHKAFWSDGTSTIRAMGYASDWEILNDFSIHFQCAVDALPPDLICGVNKFLSSRTGGVFSMSLARDERGWLLNVASRDKPSLTANSIDVTEDISVDEVLFDLEEKRMIRRLSGGAWDSLNRSFTGLPTATSAALMETLSRPGEPVLVSQTEGVNIVRFDGVFYAVDTSTGSLDITDPEARTHCQEIGSIIAFPTFLDAISGAELFNSVRKLESLRDRVRFLERTSIAFLAKKAFERLRKRLGFDQEKGTEQGK